MRNATVVNVPASGVPEPSVRTSLQLRGTCGELFQGTLDGEQCLVSCPIGRFATVEVELQDGPGWETPSASPKRPVFRSIPGHAVLVNFSVWESAEALHAPP
jgi:uncharacterized protein involved in propanediol utilization